MRFVLAMTALLLSGCAAVASTPAIPSLDERPVTKACLTDPPPATDTFNAGICKTLLSIDEEERDRDRERARVEKARLNQLRAPNSGSTSESGLTEKQRADRARLKEAYEIGRQWRQQYEATKRPVFRLKFRHQYPSMSEEEIEILVDDAIEEGVQKDRERLFDGPDMRSPVVRPPVRPPISCTSYQLGMFTNTDCY